MLCSFDLPTYLKISLIFTSEDILICWKEFELVSLYVYFVIGYASTSFSILSFSRPVFAYEDKDSFAPQ